MFYSDLNQIQEPIQCLTSNFSTLNIFNIICEIINWMNRLLRDSKNVTSIVKLPNVFSQNLSRLSCQFCVFFPTEIIWGCARFTDFCANSCSPLIAFLIALQWKCENLLREKQPKFTETSTPLHMKPPYLSNY